jgi:glucan 1,3-beta-glucosidase
MREGALPSPSAQAQVLREVVAKAKQENFRVNLIEAFDQPWKRRFEGTVGGHWGLFDDANREQKFYWDRPVSDHPYWVWQAAAGLLLAATVFGSAILAQSRRVGEESSSQTWTCVAIIAAIGGALLGITLQQAATESLGWGGLARSAALTAIAILAPMVGAGVLASDVEVPIFARTLGRRANWPAGRLSWLAGLALVAVTLAALHAALGLVFDPRYRDFPSAALTAAILPFVILSLVKGRAGGPRPLAEVAAASTLAVSAIYIAFNETFANWQALWLCAALVALAITLARVRAARD